MMSTAFTALTLLLEMMGLAALTMVVVVGGVVGLAMLASVLLEFLDERGPWDRRG